MRCSMNLMSYVLHGPRKGLFWVAEGDEGVLMSKEGDPMIVNQIKEEMLKEIQWNKHLWKIGFVSVFPLHQKKPWHWTITDQFLWKVNGGKPTSVGNSTKNRCLKVYKLQGCASMRCWTMSWVWTPWWPPLFSFPHRIHVSYIYIYIFTIYTYNVCMYIYPPTFIIVNFYGTCR